MNNMRVRFRRFLPPPAAMLLLASLFMDNCRIVHDDDPSAVRSHVDQPPDAAYVDAAEWSRSLIRDAMVAENLPGLSVAVGVDGEVVWAEGFGWADVEDRVPVTPKTRFRIGSVAMPMTATAVGLLHERGLIDLDAPVQNYARSFPDQEWTVTTRHLMAHVGGIRRLSDDEEALYQRRHCADARDALELITEDRLRFEPGTRYAYSPYGWTLVAAAVEAAADERFLDFLQREVLDPVEMPDTVLDDPAAPAADRTSLYWPAAARDTSYGIQDANDGDITCFQGADGLLSTPTDVVRFGLAMLEGRLLRTETLEMLRTPYELATGESTAHGLGWLAREAELGPASEPTKVFGHEGSSAGGTTSFVTLPEHGIVIAIATNVSFARSLATDPELGGGARPFFRVSSLPHALASAFAQAGTATQH